MTDIISSEPLAQIDYVSIVDQERLLPLKRIEKEALLAAAVSIGKIRLIDNVLINLADHADN